MEEIKEIFKQEGEPPMSVLDRAAREHNLLYDNRHWRDFFREELHCISKEKLYEMYNSEIELFKFIQKYKVFFGDKTGAISILQEEGQFLLRDYIPLFLKEYFIEGEDESLIENLQNGYFAKFRKEGNTIWVKSHLQDDMYYYDYKYNCAPKATPQEVDLEMNLRRKEKIVGKILEEVLIK